jgi:beta-phosphoglucomutase-like phosphatase (HAD superfamily)
MRTQISAILFDWDGTIVDSAQLGLNAYYKVFAELGCEFSEEIYNANYSPNWDSRGNIGRRLIRSGAFITMRKRLS